MNEARTSGRYIPEYVFISPFSFFPFFIFIFIFIFFKKNQNQENLPDVAVRLI
jgi:hypothetical protein